MFYFLIIKVKALIGYRIVIASGATRDAGISRKGNAALVTAAGSLPYTIVISSDSREIPYNRHGTLHIRAGLPACGGSPPRNPL